MLKVISANRLADGIVVYAGSGGAWFERLKDARVLAANGEAEAALAAALEDVRRNLVVDPCLVDVVEEAGVLRPLTLRESIRAGGPTIGYLPHIRRELPLPETKRENPGKPAAGEVLREAFAARKKLAPEGCGLARRAAYASGIAQ